MCIRDSEERDGEVTDEELDSLGAGDQGMMYGFACNETEELMPLPIMLAHRLAHRLADVRKAEVLPYLRPDGKTQVTVEYEGITPVGVKNIVIAAQHSSDVDIENLMVPDIEEHVIKPVVPSEFMEEKPEIMVNSCLLYTSDAADDLLCVDLGGRRIIKKKKKN